MAFAAVHAAAAKKRDEEAEEEELAGYGTDDLEGEWEFKIVRTTMGGFDNPARLQEVVESEAVAGWELLEKFDGSRLRFKRRTSARAQDDLLPPNVDPYRTQVGWGPGVIGPLVALLTLSVVGLAVGLGFAIDQAGAPDPGQPWVLVALTALAVMVVLAVVVVRRR